MFFFPSLFSISTVSCLVYNLLFISTLLTHLMIGGCHRSFWGIIMQAFSLISCKHAWMSQANSCITWKLFGNWSDDRKQSSCEHFMITFINKPLPNQYYLWTNHYFHYSRIYKCLWVHVFADVIYKWFPETFTTYPFINK